MLEALLTYSRLRTRGKAFNHFDVKPLVSRAIASSINDKRTIKITVDSIPETLFGDGEQIESLFTYLLENSIRHNLDQENLMIHIHSKRNGRFWDFSVKDNGSGIGTRSSTDLFAMFRPNTESQRSNDNLGVGLAFAKRIVTRHDGRIWINRSEQGLDIGFSLPDNELV